MATMITTEVSIQLVFEIDSKEHGPGAIYDVLLNTHPDSTLWYTIAREVSIRLGLPPEAVRIVDGSAGI